MTKPDHSYREPHQKGVNLALQGGGSHGAFTWGVLDAFFEDDRLWIDAISGTSAGAMNAVVAAHGLYQNGPAGARYLMTNLMQRLASPYDLNPFGIDPLRDLIGEMIDFDWVQNCGEMEIYIGATNVETGRVKVFPRAEITLDALMASACLPQLYQAVEVNGQHYWDGGFMGNPPLFPFYHGSPSSDIVIVQINPIKREEVPRNAGDIENRISEITFNSSLLHELRSIDFVRRLLDAGNLDETEYRRMRLHLVHARKRIRDLDASSKLNAEWAFLEYLFEIGRETAQTWLADHFDDLGSQSSVDIREMFQGIEVLPTPQ